MGILIHIYPIRLIYCKISIASIELIFSWCNIKAPTMLLFFFINIICITCIKTKIQSTLGLTILQLQGVFLYQLIHLFQLIFLQTFFLKKYSANAKFLQIFSKDLISILHNIYSIWLFLNKFSTNINLPDSSFDVIVNYINVLTVIQLAYSNIFWESEYEWTFPVVGLIFKIFFPPFGSTYPPFYKVFQSLYLLHFIFYFLKNPKK